MENEGSDAFQVLTPSEFHRLPLEQKLAYLAEAFRRSFEDKPPFREEPLPPRKQQAH
jgi:hypothetical protein